ncbi:MAG: tripartite tricarboxylate transporter substrate binding protein [Desulfobacterales bacterium]|nr:tripartite tricarboxylate transporter substrate binding protein [Desulfobacterales bacterium]
MRRGMKGMNLLVVLLVVGVFVVTPASVKAFPNKPISLVTWSSPGGGGDVLGRNLQRPLSKIAGQRVIIVNKPGGSGAVAMEYAEKMKPDGHQLLIVTLSGIITPHVAGTRLSVADFKGLIRVQLDPEVLMVRGDSPYKNAKDAIEAKKADPGGIKFAGAFLGNLDSLLCYQLFKAAGIEKYDYVPFSGGGEAMTALLGGHVQVLFGNPSEVAPQVESGQIRLISIATPERLPGLPNVPTLKEQGYDIEGVLWRGIVAPPGTPDDRIMIMNQLVKTAMQDPEFVKYTERSQLSDGYLTPEQFHNNNQKQYKAYGEIIEKMGIRKKK